MTISQKKANRYGKNPKWGLNKHLHKMVKGYKSSYLPHYISGFAAWLGQPEQKDSIQFASQNFKKWAEYVQERLKT